MINGNLNKQPQSGKNLQRKSRTITIISVNFILDKLQVKKTEFLNIHTSNRWLKPVYQK
jgi:hypothetical protein